MNRKQRRDFIRKVKRIGIGKDKAIWMLDQQSAFKTGDRVKIDYDKIIKRKEKLSEKYIEFITENKDRVFTIEEPEKYKGFFIFREDITEPKWMWTHYDIIIAEG